MYRVKILLLYALMVFIALSHSIALIIVSFLWVVALYAIAKRDIRFRLELPGIALIVFVLWCLITAAIHGFPLKDITKFYYYSPVLLMHLIYIQRAHLRRMISISIAMCALVVITAVLQNKLGFWAGFMEFYEEGRLLGVSGHFIPAAAMYSVMSIVSISLVCFSDAGRRAKVFYSVCGIIFLFGLMFTQTRSFYIAYIITILIILIQSRNRYLFYGFLITGSVVVVYIFASDKIIGRIMTIFHTVEFASNAERIALWSSAVNVIAESWNNFLFGIGFGGWKARSLEYLGKYYPSLSEAAIHRHVHNIYLQIALETGAIGLALYLFFIGSIMKNLKDKISGLKRQGLDYAYSYGIFMSIICYLIGGFFDYLQMPGILVPFYVLVSLSFVKGEDS